MVKIYQNDIDPIRPEIVVNIVVKDGITHVYVSYLTESLIVLEDRPLSVRYEMLGANGPLRFTIESV